MKNIAFVDEIALQKWYQEQEAKSRAKKNKEDFEAGAFLQDTSKRIRQLPTLPLLISAIFPYLNGFANDAQQIKVFKTSSLFIQLQRSIRPKPSRPTIKMYFAESGIDGWYLDTPGWAEV